MGGGPSVFRREDLEVYESCTCQSGAEIMELYEKFVDLGGVREKVDASEKVVRGVGADLRVMATGDAEAGKASGRKVTKAAVCKQSELRNNPFRERLCEIFSTEPMGSETWGDLSFDEFVDLYNVMSPRATKEVKTQAAFRIYDYDGNGYLTAEDIAQLLKQIATTPKGRMLLDPQEIKDIVERVMRDCTRSPHPPNSSSRRYRGRVPCAHACWAPSRKSTDLPCALSTLSTAGDIDGNNRLSYAEFSKVVGRIPDFEVKFRIYIQ